MKQRRKWLIEGIVQGVGFRPHVARVAASFGVTGFVGNDDARVFIEAQGEASVLAQFIQAVVAKAPPLAHINHVRESELPLTDTEREFQIVASRRVAGARTLIPPDIATCPQCVADMSDPQNRRYEYAFTTCTNCGPRLSIIMDVPYDRPFTTMRDFPMCPQCAQEYENPQDRRYHAEPISCFNCGPHLWTVWSEQLPLKWIQAARDPFEQATPVPQELVNGALGGRSREAQQAAVHAAQEALRAGKIVAVKGIGGFHLLVNAADEAAVRRLRERKHRDGKPFAVMVRDIEQARRIVELGAADSLAAQAIAGPQRPIVLAPRVSVSFSRAVQSGASSPRVLGEQAAGAWQSEIAGVQEVRAPQRIATGGDSGDGADKESSGEGARGELSREERSHKRLGNDLVADAVAPGLTTLGVMIAYSPLHQLLLAGLDTPVVATSGNLSQEPLCYTNEQALLRLSGIADVFLMHNRDIAVPVEDSVVQANPDGTLTPVRRSRGYAPVPVQMPQLGPVPGPGQRGQSMPAAIPESKSTQIRGLRSVPVSISHVAPFQKPAAVLAASHEASSSADHRSTLSVLGAGAELKNTFTLVRDGMGFVSAHIGDMGSLESQQAYETAIEQLLTMHHEHPSVIVHDAHPNYATTAWAERYAEQQRAAGANVAVLQVQHHRAHALSLLAEHGAALWGKPFVPCDSSSQRAVIAAVDGTGYGDDGAIWGSEIFSIHSDQLGIAPEQEAIPRLWHLPYFQLVGGDTAVREPWRLALAMCQAFGINPAGLGAGGQGLVDWAGSAAGRAVHAQLAAHAGVPVDSVGRYFDAVAAMLGLCEVARYEADAAVQLQEAAQRYLRHCVERADDALAPGSCGISGISVGISECSGGIAESAGAAAEGIGAAVRSLARSFAACPNSATAERCAFFFHERLAAALSTALSAAAQRNGVRTCGITGGSSVNVLLIELIRSKLAERGFTLYVHQKVPPNDGGLSLGQAYYGWLWAQRRH
ncbi:MAG: carbamoyltransferase HypF [Arcanobacterium sp.]|nr:carbamoyltransferase HypF [Arcanobacterium sp.]